MKQKIKKTRLEKVFSVYKWIVKYIYSWIFPFKKHGNLKRFNDGAYIIVGNHYSVFDIVPASTITDKPMHIMAKSNLWSKKIGAYFLDLAECIAAKRDGSDVQAVKSSLRYLKNGEIVVIFPEGTRNKSYDSFLPFKSGAAALSIKTRTPIIPVIQIKKIQAFRQAQVVVGDPIEFREFYGKKMSTEDLQSCDNRLRDIMWNMRQSYIDRYGDGIKKSK